MKPKISSSSIFSLLLNSAIKLSGETNIENLEGSSFIISIDELPQDIIVIVKDKKFIALDNNEVTTVDVTISGNIQSIVFMIQDQGDLESDDLYISGKISVVKQFQQLLSSLYIDWEFFFSKIMPSSAAKKTSDIIDQVISFAIGGKNQLISDFKSYILEEKDFFVKQDELKQHKNNIQQFSDRINKLVQKASSL